MQINTAALNDLTDADLADLYTQVVTEQNRRNRLANAPAEIVAIAQQYAADGGNRSDLVDQINGTPDTPESPESGPAN